MPPAMSARASAARRGSLLLVVTALGLAGCGSSTPTTVITHHELRLRVDEYRILPRSVSVPPGRLKIVVTNNGVLAHNLEIERNGIVLGTISTVLPGGLGGPIKVTLPPGTYTLASTNGDAANLGMMSTLVVRAH